MKEVKIEFIEKKDPLSNRESYHLINFDKEEYTVFSYGGTKDQEEVLEEMEWIDSVTPVKRRLRFEIAKVEEKIDQTINTIRECKKHKSTGGLDRAELFLEFYKRKLEVFEKYKTEYLN